MIRLVSALFLVALMMGAAPSYAAPDEVGPLVIDEVFLGSGQASPFLGDVQWIEVVNAGLLPLDVTGLELAADDRAPIALEADAPIPPGGYFVLLVTSDASLALTAQVADALDFPLQVVVTVPLPATTAALSVRASDGDVLDWLPIGQAMAAVDLPGAAFALDPGFLSPEGNNEPSHWCASIDKTALLGLLLNGTPGDVNAWCDNDGDGYSESQGDCADDQPGTNPAATEVCDGVDNDCNGQVDDTAWLEEPDAGACLSQGVCFGVAPQCQGGAWACVYPAAHEEVEVTCDGQDNDCDGSTDEGLTNACGVCGALPGELCDGLDNDCDGVVDEGLTPPSGGCELSVGVCQDAHPVCQGAPGWACDYGASYEAGETLCDELDNDCDGTTDEGFPLGELCVVQVRACQATGTWACSDDHHGVVCAAPTVGQGSELCGDGVDNDCDGETDEGYPVGDACEVGSGACRATGRYACTDDDRGVVCDAAPLPPTDEICDDLQDNDCDGETDELDCVVGDPTIDDLGGGAVRCAMGFSPAPAGPTVLLLALTLILSRLFGRKRTLAR